MICAAKISENVFDDNDTDQRAPAQRDDFAAETTAFQYTGHDFDPEVGLQYHQARHFDSAVGRWLNQDPVRFEDGANLYRYVGNAPCNVSDPTTVE